LYLRKKTCRPISTLVTKRKCKIVNRALKRSLHSVLISSLIFLLLKNCWEKSLICFVHLKHPVSFACSLLLTHPFICQMKTIETIETESERVRERERIYNCFYRQKFGSSQSMETWKKQKKLVFKWLLPFMRQKWVGAFRNQTSIHFKCFPFRRKSCSKCLSFFLSRHDRTNGELATRYLWMPFPLCWFKTGSYINTYVCRYLRRRQRQGLTDQTR
jgi:hypothetical protein